MKTALAALGLLSALCPAYAAGTCPTLSVEIYVRNCLKNYAYTLTNDLGSGGPIDAFAVFMTEPGARSVIAFTSSKPAWFAHASLRGDVSSWMISAIAGAQIQSGEQVTFTLTTPVDVPTADSYTPPTYPSNWWWSGVLLEGGFGTPNVPVPIPEPSSLLVLTSGLAGVAGAVMRRRKRGV